MPRHRIPGSKRDRSGSPLKPQFPESSVLPDRLLLKPPVSGYFPPPGQWGVFVRTRKPAFLWTLLLAVVPSFADEDLGMGPWRLGMTREQATSFADQGPYTDG